MPQCIPITESALQGSVLGPLISYIYINVLPNDLNWNAKPFC